MKKENIEFVALGRNQIEFYDSGGKEYINIYDPNPRASLGICLNLRSCKVTKFKKSGYKIEIGNKMYVFKISEHQGGFVAKIVGKLWGWLPIIWFSGEFSRVGYDLFIRKMERYT